MQSWHWTCLLLCLVGLSKEFRPSERYVTKYLIDHKNFTNEEVIHVIYPIATYTYLSSLPVIFLLTDYMRYKPVLICQGVAFFSCYVILTWGQGMAAIKVVEVLYGVASAADVAYFTYIYAQVEKSLYKKVTSFIHVAHGLGNLIAATVAQLLVSTHILTIPQLNYLTLMGMFLALFFSCCLPNVDSSLYFFHKEDNDPEDRSGYELKETGQRLPRREELNGKYESIKSWTRPAKAITDHIKTAYKQSVVAKWSFWWAIAHAGYYQITYYVQSLWEIISAVGTEYNGAVDAIHRLLASLMTVVLAHVVLSWRKWGEIYLSIFSLIQGIFIIIMSQETSLIRTYALYIAYRIIFQITSFIASAEIAENISDDSYALIFGINTFIAVLFQTALTFIVTEEEGIFRLGERDQYLVYGGYHLLLGIFFAVVLFISCCFHRDSQPRAICDENTQPLAIETALLKRQPDGESALISSNIEQL